jgi:outer membrane protein assembly factor BamB
LHDAGNNPVAADTQVGPPRSLQWLAPPRWLRSHETPSGIEGLVSSDSRIFYFLDEGLIGITDQRLPERWALVCRDAFNGRLLWQRPLGDWGWPEWAKDKFADTDWTEIRGGRTVVPVENHRRLVADGDRLYATLAFRSPLSILDAASGDVVATVADTEPVRDVLARDGIVVVHSRDPLAPSAKRRGAEDRSPSRLIAVEGRTGQVLWKEETKPIGSLTWAVDQGRVVYQAGTTLTALDQRSGRTLWTVDGPKGNSRALIAHQGLVLAYAGNALEVREGISGNLLWGQEVPSSAGAEGEDLFVVDGVVWRGMIPVDQELKPVGKSADVLALGYDLRTGEECRRIVAREFRSPEHHHRCYRNKATSRYLISGMEGAEFLGLDGQDHTQNNFLRGACRLGVMPCNGLLYVPADQCFCQPGAKLLGFTAVAGALPSRRAAVADDQRLERGPVYESAPSPGFPAGDPGHDWPTFRHDAARHGATSAEVSAKLAAAWRTELGGRLTAPIATAGRVYVAQCDAHTLHALDASDGKSLWSFVAGGRIDSPPTAYQDLLLFGSADGYVYCLRAADGALAWRFLAAVRDCRIGSFDQFESVWPVHGSVLLHEGVAYLTAGRSTYLDDGIRVYALEPRSGRVLHQTTLEGPWPKIPEDRDVAFYVDGANSDVLVSEGGFVYLRQKKLTPDLREVEIPDLSSKGEKDVGLHVFSTAGLLDGSWYNRTFWMYARRWPGFQLANQAPKSGQLLVVDDRQTYAVNPFYRRNVHSPMFFPGKEGYLVFADRNTTEPQIVGEPGARPPVEWLPQSHIPREGNPGLDSPAFGLDKMIGYTRAEPPVWARFMPIRVRGMVKTAGTLFVAGPPDEFDRADPYAAFEGRRGARLAAVSPGDGQLLAEQTLPASPVFDGLIAVPGRLYAALEDGSLVCLADASQ